MKRIILISAFSALAMADYTLTMQMGGTQQKFFYKDDAHMLLEGNEGGRKVTQLVNGEKIYSVTTVNGKKRYLDMSAMLSQFSQMGGQSDAMQKPEIEVIHKGGTKTVAGVKAQEWTISVKDQAGIEKDKVLVTNDKDLVNAMNGFSKFMSKLSPEGETGNMYEVKEGYVIVAGDGFRVTNLDKSDLPDTLFAASGNSSAPTHIGQTKKPLIHIKKPPVCAIIGKHGEATMLHSIAKSSADGWKMIDSGTCSDMMGMHLENALYQKGDGYIHLSLSVNDPHNQGLIATYKLRGLSITGLKRGKLQGHRYQMARLDMAGIKALDIKLPNALLEVTATENVTDDLLKTADDLLHLADFKPVKRTMANPQDALKDVEKMFGGKGGSTPPSGGPSQEDLKKAAEMMKGLFGQ